MTESHNPDGMPSGTCDLDSRTVREVVGVQRKGAPHVDHFTVACESRTPCGSLIGCRLILSVVGLTYSATAPSADHARLRRWCYR